MSALHKKLRREIWQLRGQVLAIALVIAGGVAVCLMSLVNYASLTATRTQYYSEYQFADVFAPLKRAPRHLLEVIEAIPGVSRAVARVEGAAQLEITGFTDPVTARLVSLPPAGQPLVNRVFLREGRLPEHHRSDEVAVLGGFAEAHSLRLGDEFAAIINGRRQTLRIAAIVESPEFVLVMPPGGMVPDFERYGVVWMAEEALAAAMDMRGAFNSLVLRGDPRYSLADIIDHLDRILERYGGTGAYAREDQLSHRFLAEEMSQLKTMATVFPLMFMGVAMFLLNVVISRLIGTQRDIIAVLKAFGYSNRQVGWHYSQLVFLIAAVGLVIGMVGGLWLGRMLGGLYMESYRFPALLFRISPWWLLLLLFITFVVAWLGAWRSIYAAASLPPAEAMRPPGPARFRVTLLERLLSDIRFTQPSRMIVRQLARQPARTGLAALGIALATAIVMVGNFQFDSVSLMVHAQFARVQQQDASISLVETVNSAAVFGLARQPGIAYAEGRRTIAVRLANGHREWRTTLTGIPEDAQLQFVIDKDLNKVEIPKRGLLLTDYLANELEVAAGDTLQVQVMEGERQVLAMPVAGVTSEFLGVGAYLRLDSLSRALDEGPVINQALINVEPDQALQVYDALREMPKVMAINIRQSMLDSFYETLARTFLTFTFVNSLLGGIIAFGVIYNTVRIALAEKGRELASLRVLGYSNGEVGHILLGELAVLLALGIPLGWLLGEVLAQALVIALQSELYRVPLVISVQTLALATAVVISSALVSGAIAWRRLRRLDLVAVLKTRE